MTNIKFIKTITSAVILSAVVSSQAFAYDEIDCPSNSPTGATCWKCANNASDCTATYSNGKLIISGTGQMKNYSHTRPNGGFLTTAPWKDEVENITSIEVKGVSTVGECAFIGLNKVTSVNITDDVTKLDFASFHTLTGLSDLYIPKSVKSFGNLVFDNLPNVKIYVEQGISIPSVDNKTTQFLTYKQKDGAIYVYDSQGKIYSIYDSYDDLKNGIVNNTKNTIQIDENGNIILYDSNGNILGKYTSAGALISKYLYNDDGSTSIYDANGKLTGLKNAKSITPAEAAALVKKGNHNTVTLTFK